MRRLVCKANLLLVINKYAASFSKIFFDYIYTATGALVQKKVTDGGTLQYTENYLGAHTYKTMGTNTFSANDLSYISTGKGRWVKNAGGFYVHEFYLKDHLGNTRVAYSDDNNDGLVNTTTEVKQYASYYPFGMLHNRYSTVTDDNRKLYNGKEFQSDLNLDWYDYGARFYDPQIGRFHSIDKMSETTPYITPYRYAFNNPLRYIDADGNFEMDANQAQQYQRLAQYLKNGIQEIANNPKVMGALMKYGQFSKQGIVNDLKWGKGPKVNVTTLNGAYGDFTPGIGSKEVRLNDKFVKQLETATGADRDALLFLLAVSLLHEYTHYGDDQDGVDYSGAVGNGEEGNAFELTAYGDIITGRNATQVIEQWKQQQEQEKKKQEEENKNKQQGLNSMLGNFNNLQEGKYEWNGTSWVKTD